MNDATIEQSAIGNYNQLANNISNTIRCATFARVTAVYANGRAKTDTVGYRAKKTVDVQPIVKESRTVYDASNYNTSQSAETKEYYTVSPIYNVPYISGWSPSIDDYCVLIHLDKSIQGLLKETATAESDLKATNDSHSLSDCVAIGSFGPFGD